MATTKAKNYYVGLNAIPFADKIEKKGQFDYLSWANAWDILKKIHPEAQRVVYEHDHTGLNYFTDGSFAYVKVGIIVNGLEHIDMLPIMNNRNKSIPCGEFDSMDVLNAIQRSTAKAIAMHGLGIQLWSGEDVAYATTNVKATAEAKPKGRVIHTLNIGDENLFKVLEYVAANKKLGLPKIVAQLQRKYKLSADVKKEIDKTFKAK